MKKSVETALKLSELRGQINDLPEDVTTEARDLLTNQYRVLESEYRAALVSEDDSGADRLDTSGEGAEIRRMRTAASFGQYIAASAGRRAVTGVENELNAALNVPELGFPLTMLLTPSEFRASIDGDSETSQGSWLDRVFHDSAAERLGVSFRSVGAGIASYPVTTAGGSPAQRAREQAAAAGTFTVGVTEMKPTRAAINLSYQIEDTARLPGLADAIQRDMRMAMMEGVDKSIFVGDTTATGTDADITGFSTAAIMEKTITQANKIKGPETLAEFAGLLDGQYAASPADLRVVAAEGANVLWMSTVPNSGADSMTLAQFLRANGVNWTVRGDIETATANGDFGAFIGLGRGIEGAAISAIWDAGSLVSDPYSDAESGTVHLVLNYLHQFSILRPANFRRIKFVA